MEIDIGNVLGSVTRTVRNFAKDGKPASTVTLSRLYDTNVDDLWDALTNARRIPRWFLPIEGDLKLGGKYQLEGNAPNGKEFVTQSGELWRAAHVLSGADPTSAKERSDRTITFYRGETPQNVAHPGTGS